MSKENGGVQSVSVEQWILLRMWCTHMVWFIHVPHIPNTTRQVVMRNYIISHEIWHEKHIMTLKDKCRK